MNKANIVASVCTFAFLLAKAKVLSNHKVTTHWEDISDLRKKLKLANQTAKKMQFDWIKN